MKRFVEYLNLNFIYDYLKYKFWLWALSLVKSRVWKIKELNTLDSLDPSVVQHSQSEKRRDQLGTPGIRS